MHAYAKESHMFTISTISASAACMGVLHLCIYVLVSVRTASMHECCYDREEHVGQVDWI